MTLGYAVRLCAFALAWNTAGAADKASLVLRAGTEVHLELIAPLSTRTVKPHDEFRLRTRAPIVVDGVELVPAGTPALGQVIHAQKAGAFGKAAELILVVRRIELGDQTIPMHKFEPTAGRDRTGTAAGLGMAPYVWVFAPFIRGGQIDLPAGTDVVSYVTRDTELAAPSVGDREQAARDTPASDNEKEQPQ